MSEECSDNCHLEHYSHQVEHHIARRIVQIGFLLTPVYIVDGYCSPCQILTVDSAD